MNTNTIIELASVAVVAMLALPGTQMISLNKLKSKIKQIFSVRKEASISRQFITPNKIVAA